MADDDLVVVIKGKQFRFANADKAGLSKAIEKAWQPTLRGYRAQLDAMREMVETHKKFREGYFATARVIEALTSAYPPSDGDMKAAQKALDDLVAATKADYSSGNFDAMHKAHEWAFKAIHGVARLLELYTRALCEGTTNFVEATQFVYDHAGDVIEVVIAMRLAGNPKGAAIAAGAAGGFKELQAQIVAAQGSQGPGLKWASVIVLTAAAREGVLKGMMLDGKFKTAVVTQVADRGGKVLLKFLDKSVVTEVITKMFEKGWEEFIVSSLRQLIKEFTPGQSMTFDKAVQAVATDVLKKVVDAPVIVGLDKKLNTMTDLLLMKIAKGEIKGVSVEAPEIKKNVKKVCETAVKKVAEGLLLASLPNISNFADEVVDKVLNDKGFKAEVTKIAAKKK